LALITLSFKITEVQPRGWFKRTDNTIRSCETSIDWGLKVTTPCPSPKAGEGCFLILGDWN
jgi:hypothetical protein